MAKRKRDYQQYLTDKTTEINNAIKAQRFSLNFHYPTLREIKDIVEMRAPRIYEKIHIIMIFALQIRHNKYKKSFELDYNEDEFIPRRDELLMMLKNCMNFTKM